MTRPTMKNGQKKLVSVFEAPNFVYRKQGGFLMVEVLISVAILVLTVIGAISMVFIGFQAINFNANSIEASWLAQEGVNGLRGIRDSNWLRFGFDKQTCWKTIGATCPGGAEIGDVNNYRFTVDETGVISLDPIGTINDLDLSDGSIDTDDEPFRLYYNDSDGDGEHDFVVHTDADPLPDTFTPSKFFREINIISSTAEKIEGEISVQWLDGGTGHEISLPITLTNYSKEI